MTRIKHQAVLYQCNLFMALADAHYKPKLPPNLSGLFATLTKDLGLLAQTWSIMAGRNLMNDILRSLGQIEPLLAADLKKPCADAKTQIGKILQGHNITRARYDSVLCLGYKVKTAGPAYSGNVDDWADMQQRCQDMKDAIVAAYKLADTEGSYNSEKRMLKVFMAPEFFFRGRNGAYEHAVIAGQAPMSTGTDGKPVPAKPGIIDLLAQEIDKDIYKDWVFVLGTAIGATRSSRTVCKDCGGDIQYVRDGTSGKTKPVCKKNDKHTEIKEQDVGATIDNIAFIWKEGEVHTIAKELVSNQDFVKNRAAGITNKVTVGTEELTVKISSRGTADDKPSKFQDERMGGGIFTIDGVTFGMEICLDHAASVANSTSGRLDNAANIQVQLIPSAGMGIKQWRTVEGGIVFNVDGTTPHVQVIAQEAGATGADVRYDWGDRSTKEYELALPGKVGWDAPYGMQTLLGIVPLNTWNVLSTAPKVASGTSGSVLLYGPYALP